MTQPDLMDLLESIPEERMTQRQKAFHRKLPMYQFRQEPTHFDGIEWAQYGELTVWRDNGTLLCICKDASKVFIEHNVGFSINNNNNDPTFFFECAIYGSIYADDDCLKEEEYEAVSANIAETATFFCSLKETGERASRLTIEVLPFRCDFAAFTPKQLARILDANPKRYFEFDTGYWSAEQSVVLATRSYPLDVSLCDRSGEAVHEFGDGGTAFVDALEKRQPTFFGSLCFYHLNSDEVPLNNTNLQRLLKLDLTFGSFEICGIHSTCALLPFYVKTDYLEDKIHACDFRPSAFDTLDILAKDLNLRVCVNDDDHWDERVISFLNRVAELGHFESLGFSAGTFELEFFDAYFAWDHLAPAANALIGAIHANPKLSYLDLSNPEFEFPLDWGPHLPIIFKAMESHSCMRKLYLEEYPLKFDSDYSWLKQLLSRNRDIAVMDRSGKKFTDGSTIDKLYDLNHLYNGSIQLVKENTSRRPLLVATALMERASNKFPHTALLLSQHTDMLCELIQGSEESVASQSVSLPRDSMESVASKVRRLE